MANVLAVFAHPDDEVLGCGGALAKHAENGDLVWVRILSTRSRELSVNATEAFLALGLAHDADTGHTPLVCGSGLIDQQFDTVPFSELVSLIANTEPDIVYTHHPGDLNLDHALTARAVLTAFRPKPGEKPRTILACEVLSSTEWTFPPVFAPNWFERLSPEQLEKKVRALECYPTEAEDFPHPRSEGGIVHLAAVRGQQVGVEAAEAFQLLRRGPF